MFKNKRITPISNEISRNIQQTCNEINNKMNIASRLNELFSAKFIHNALLKTFNNDDVHSLQLEKYQNHENKMKNILNKYENLFQYQKQQYQKNHEEHNAINKREELFIVFNELLFSIKVIDACMFVEKQNPSIEKRNFLMDTMDNLTEFVNLFILNYMSNQHDFILKLKKVDMLIVFLDILKLLKRKFKEKKINISMSGIYDAESVILGDCFYLFYSFLHIVFFIINKLFTYGDSMNIEKSITFGIVNVASQKSEHIKNIKVDISVPLPYDIKLYNEIIDNINLFDDSVNKKNGFYICKKIIITHNGSVHSEYNADDKTFHFIVTLPYIKNDIDHFQTERRKGDNSDTASKIAEEVLLLNYSQNSTKINNANEIPNGLQKRSISNPRLSKKVSNIRPFSNVKSAPVSRIASRRNSFRSCKSSDITNGMDDSVGLSDMNDAPLPFKNPLPTIASASEMPLDINGTFLNTSELHEKLLQYSATLDTSNNQNQNQNIQYNALEEDYDNTIIRRNIEDTRILIVDDSKLNQKFLLRILSGFFKEENIFMLENGMEAINEVYHNNIQYDIIFMDNNMPFLKGSLVINILRKFSVDGLIVGLTGDEINIIDNAMLDNGANITYKKPIKREEIEKIYKFWEANISADYTDKMITHDASKQLIFL